MKVTISGTKMVLEFEIDPKGRPSNSGKTLIVYTTGGFVPVDGGYKVNLNVVK